MWEKVKLGKVIDVISGKNAPKDELFNNNDRGLPFIRAGHLKDLIDQNIFEMDLLKIDNDIAKKLKLTSIKPNTILFAKSGMSATLNRIYLTKSDCYFVNHLAALFVKTTKISIKYLYWFLYYFNPSKLIQGESYPSINLLDIKEIEIPLPPLPIQEKIAAILDKADELRRKDKDLQTKYDELAQAIFIDMFGDPVRNEKGWEVKKLEEVTEVGSSRRVFVDELVESGIPFYRGTEIGELATNNSVNPSLFISKEHYEKLKLDCGVPKKGDLLLPSICPDGRIWVVDNNNEFYYKDGRVLHVKVKSNFIDSIYLKNHLKYLFLNNYNKIASGTTFAELKIFILKNIEIQIPPIQLQEAFAQKIELINQLKAQTNADKSEELFQSLLQRAFKGELVS